MVNVTGPIERPPAVLAIDAGCVLGESIVWCDRFHALWWTDIEARRIWRHHPASGERQGWDTPGRVGSLALCESGALLLGMEDALWRAVIDPDAAGIAPDYKRLCDVPLDGPTLRINDGRVDRHGNFVFGTLNGDPARARTGRFFQYSTRHGLRSLDIEPVAIANGICFTPDGTGMYYCDSLQRRIMHARYDAATARVSSPRVFAVIDAPGEPDGAIVDADGHVWSAQWGAARVVRHALSGEVERIVPVPTPQPTCMTFAGADRDTLFITSAKTGLDDATLQALPGAGGVFTATLPGVHGLVEARVAGA